MRNLFMVYVFVMGLMWGSILTTLHHCNQRLAEINADLTRMNAEIDATLIEIKKRSERFP